VIPCETSGGGITLLTIEVNARALTNTEENENEQQEQMDNPMAVDRGTRGVQYRRMQQSAYVGPSGRG